MSTYTRASNPAGLIPRIPAKDLRVNVRSWEDCRIRPANRCNRIHVMLSPLATEDVCIAKDFVDGKFIYNLKLISEIRSRSPWVFFLAAV